MKGSRSPSRTFWTSPRSTLVRMVFNELVGLHDIGADLAAEADFGLGGVELAQVFAALFEFGFVELRAQNLHGDFAVLVLAALVLALDDDAGREGG